MASTVSVDQVNATMELPGFEFGIPTRLLFGNSGVARLGAVCLRFGWKSAFVVVDPDVRRVGMADSAFRSLEEHGFRTVEFTGVQPNPIDTDIERGAEVFRADQSDVVIGIGGGSAMDTAKGIALLATNGGRIREYEGTDKVPRDIRPLICIPTTAGTGSEASAQIAVTNSETHEKMSVRSIRNYARVAVLDPTLLHTLPAGVAVASGMDALVHAVESSVSRRSNALTQLFALEAIRRISRSLEIFVQDRANAFAAADMLFASCLAGIAIGNAGTGAAHAVARALGGHYNVAHGVACGVLLAPVMRFNLSSVQGEYAAVAEALGVVTPGMSERERAEAAAQRVAEIRTRIGLPERLTIRPTPSQTTAMAEWASRNAGPNPSPTSADDVRRLIAQVVME